MPGLLKTHAPKEKRANEAAEARKLVGIIGHTLTDDGRPTNIIGWVETKGRPQQGEGYKFPPLGPYAKRMYEELFKKWGADE